MSSDAQKVTVGKPRVGGAVFRAPAGTTLPTTATETLNNAFKDLGYISEDGIKKSIERSTEDIKAWGGDTVGNTQTEFKDQFTIKFLEALNLDVLKAVYVDENVSGTLASGVHIKVNSKEQQSVSWVIDTVMTGGVLSRMVIPYGKVIEVGEVEYVDGSPVAHEVTIGATPDSGGDTHHEYLVNPS